MIHYFFWLDLYDRFAEFEHINEFVINTNIDAKDFDGNSIHPQDFETVFPKGTWVDADFFCCV